MSEILDTPIIPDFGDKKKDAREAPAKAKAASGPAPETKPSEVAESSGKRKICFIASKGNLDMAYPALIMANAALGEGIETHIFFTFWGFDLVTERTMDNLKFTMVGNTAMHLPMAKNLPLWSGMGIIPGMTTMSTKMMKGQLDALEIPSVREMLDIIVASGGHLWGCRMSFDMMKLSMADMYDGLDAIISANDFIEMTEGAQLLFI